MNNPWMQLASSTLGMLGGNSMGCGMGSMGYGLGSFGGLTGMGCSNIFTDCYGEPNYEAMAGWGVANAVIGVGLQAWQSHQANKEPEVNYSQELETISQEIKTKETEKAEQTDIINTKTKEIATARETITTLTGERTTAQNKLDDLKKELNDATSLTTEAKNALEAKIAQAEKDVNAIDDKIAAQNKIIEDAEEAKQTAETKEAKLQDEIDGLKEKQRAYQDKVDTRTIQDTHIKGKKSEKDDAENWYNLKESGAQNTHATQEQLKRAHTELASAMKKGNAEDIAKWKKIFIAMYEDNENTFKEIPGYEKLYKAVK